MPLYARLERHPGEIGAIIDHENHLVIFYTNTAEIEDSIDLETIPAGPSGFSPGIVIDYGKWDSLYCVRKHKNWDEVDYLAHAKKLMYALGIKKP